MLLLQKIVTLIIDFSDDVTDIFWTKRKLQHRYLEAKRPVLKNFVVTNHFIFKHTFKNIDHHMKEINCKCGQKLNYFISRNPRTLQRCTLPLPFVPFLGSVRMKYKINDVKTIALALTCICIYNLRLLFY